MNEMNYGSLEACKRLVDAGIMLETECKWYHHTLARTEGIWKLENIVTRFYNDAVPAPSMAEIWRELPGKTLLRIATMTWAWIDGEDGSTQHNANPTDALIDLLIYVKEEK